MLKFLVLLGFCFGFTLSHTYHSGQCPSVEPQSGFEMSKFLGVWYAVQKTSTASSCLIYNITRGEEPGEYKIQQTSQHLILGLTPLKHNYSYTGDITVPDNDIPAKMKVKFPLNIAGSSSFTVFMTDYENYGGIFSCQKLGPFHRRSATLLSRTKILDRIYIDKLRNRLASSLVDPFDLSIINQTGCPGPESGGVNIGIDDETFSAHNVANVFRKAGEKIGDGVEYTISAGKKLYNKVSDKESTSNHGGDSLVIYEKIRDLREYPAEKDSEWITV
ncbi:apolipoprotein D-like [Condylostylus longicornis]|uniref:apolipoprotein D-like n=1 Tax=Condylostylus longicornis TaxID=2530218 RepID=UPI00244DFB51|nr:apolipoprotein D-like [Condylostylus longicornis]